MATQMEYLIGVTIGLLVGYHVKQRETHPREVHEILLRLCGKSPQ
jgi:hypothetical protein